MKCKKCGQEYLGSEIVIFCEKCGCKLDDNIEQEQKEFATGLMPGENINHEQQNDSDAKDNIGEKKNSITLQECNGANIVLDPESFNVKNPKRATKIFWEETFSTCGKFLLFGGIVWVIALIVSAFLHGVNKNLGPNPLTLLEFVTITSVAFLPFMMIWRIAKTFSRGNRVPDMETPEGTVTTFLKAIEIFLYKRACNCLTDDTTIRNINIPQLLSSYPGDYLSKKIFAVHKYLFQKAPAANSSNPEQKRVYFWGRLFRDQMSDPSIGQVKLDFHNIKTEQIDPQIVKVSIPAEIKWEWGKKKIKYEEVIEIPFILVKRDKYWFIANTVFLPIGQKYTKVDFI